MDKSFLILFFLTSCLALVDSETGKTTKKQPHIVFIVADDLGEYVNVKVYLCL